VRMKYQVAVLALAFAGVFGAICLLLDTFLLYEGPEDWSGHGAPTSQLGARTVLAVLMLAGGVAVLALLVRRDRRMEALRRDLEAADAACRMQQDALAQLSQRLRTPVNAIVGWCDLLARENLSASQHQLILTVQDAAQGVGATLNNVLDLVKLETGRLSPQTRDCSIRKLLAALEAALRPAAARKGIKFGILATASVPAVIRTDEACLRQCLVNLLANAFQATESGQVILTASLQECDSQAVVRFDVADTGAGIAAEKQQAIAALLDLTSDTLPMVSPGNGLGLAITARLVHLLGGKLSLLSKPDRGSTFSLMIPPGVPVDRKALPRETAAPVRTAPLPSALPTFVGHVLLAEDNASNRLFLSLILKKMGLQVTAAADGQEALDLARGHDFDMILLDVVMPNLDGYQVASALREEGLTTPIVAVTGSTLHGDGERSREAGCDDFLAKPVDRKRLCEVLGRFLKAAGSTPRADMEAVVTLTPASIPTLTPPSATGPLHPDALPLLSEWDEDPTLREVIAVFVSELPGTLDQIIAAAEQADVRQLQGLLHTLKGAGASAGFPQVAEKAAELERLVSQSKFNTLQAAVDELVLLCQRVQTHPSGEKTTS
jgi:two-component system, sensor histidine kinase